MKIRLGIPVLIFLFAAGPLYPGGLRQKDVEKLQEKEAHKSLIRKDLLASLDKDLIPPKRNIFTRRRSGAIPGAVSSPEGFQAFQPPRQNESAERQDTAGEKTRLNVKYIGYVQSGNRVVALIILEGEIFAVETGDVLERGVTIGSITPTEIEVIDKGSEPIRVNLEGEKP
jgi:hypothetical protein